MKRREFLVTTVTGLAGVGLGVTFAPNLAADPRKLNDSVLGRMRAIWDECLAAEQKPDLIVCDTETWETYWEEIQEFDEPGWIPSAPNYRLTYFMETPVEKRALTRSPLEFQGFNYPVCNDWWRRAG